MSGISPVGGVSQSNQIEGAGTAPIEKVPAAVIREVLGRMLPPKDLSALSRASKTLRGIMILPLKRAWEEILAEITIGAEKWNELLAKLGVEQRISEVSPLPESMSQTLKSDCPFFKGKKVFQTHRLVLMPAGLSINKLSELLHQLGEGKTTTAFIGALAQSVFKEFGDKEVTESYWALITTDIVPGSLSSQWKTSPWDPDTSFSEKTPVEEKGYEAPFIIEAMTLVILNKEFGKAEKYLLSHPSFTNCVEQINEDRVTVGAFSSSVLMLTSYTYQSGDIGVLAVRRFFRS